MAMVESQRRFGPGAIATLVLILSSVAFAMFYDSKDRSATSSAKGPVTKSANNLQSTAASQKDRAPVNGPDTKREASERKQSERVEAMKKEANDSERANQKMREAVTTNSRAKKAQKPQNSQQSGPPQSVGAPALRLPNPELGNESSTPSGESRTHSFGTSKSAPQFFRSTDGTLTVKFPDGSTRVVKPGAKAANPSP